MRLLALAPVLVSGALLLIAAADSVPLTALKTLAPGQWELTSRDGDFARRAMCLGDPRALLQIAHANVGSCSSFVVQNDADTSVVNYSCPGAGNGRTSIHVETPRLAQIQTQGIVRGAPFDLSIEARRTGECTAISMR